MLGWLFRVEKNRIASHIKPALHKKVCVYTTSEGHVEAFKVPTLLGTIPKSSPIYLSRGRASARRPFEVSEVHSTLKPQGRRDVCRESAGLSDQGILVCYFRLSARVKPYHIALLVAQSYLQKSGTFYLSFRRSRRSEVLYIY